MVMEIEHSEVAGNGWSVIATSVQDVEGRMEEIIESICLASGSCECLGLVLQYRRNTTTLREASNIVRFWSPLNKQKCQPVKIQMQTLQ